MKKEDIEELVNNYNEYIPKLLNVEARITEILHFYYEKHHELISAKDFRPGTFGRLQSAVLVSKFFFHTTLNYVKQKEWDEDYRANILPKKFTDPNYLEHFLDIDTGIRFYLFHSVHHQVETTYRILHKALKLDGGKSIEEVTKKLNIYDEELIKLFDATRNTIHNNGYYMPIGKKQEKEFTANLNGKKIAFKENNPITITTNDFIEIALSEIEYIYKAMQNDEIVSLPIIKDFSV